MSALALAGVESVVVGAIGGGTTALVRRAATVRHADQDRSGSSWRAQGGFPSLWIQAVCGLGAGAIVWAITTWPVAGLWAAAGGAAVPVLVRRDRERGAATARLDAWATWVGLIAGQLAGQASLAEAVLAACRRAPGALSGELAPLLAAVEHLPLDEALRAWGAGEDGSAELRQVSLVLSLAAGGAGGHVSQVLSQLGGQLRARAASARRVERERRRTRLAGRAAAGVAVTWVLLGSRFDTSLFGVYSHPGGQALLGVLLGVLAAGLWGLARLDRGLA